jgi:hypothetical protein
VIKVYQAPNDPSLPADGRTWCCGQAGLGRGATSYASNWHAFRGGWDEDWQVGGKAVIPRTFPDGTSNTIAYFERYSICGNHNLPNGPGYIEHIWNEDGQNANFKGHIHNITANATPGWWAPPDLSLIGTGNEGKNGKWSNVNKPPPGYPLLYITLPQVAPAIRDCDPLRLQAFSAGGIQVLMVDGSVKAVSTSISQLTWAYAIMPDDGQVLGGDW